MVTLNLNLVLSCQETAMRSSSKNTRSTPWTSLQSLQQQTADTSSFDDLDGSVNLILLLTALFLSFSIPIMLGTFSRDDLIAADAAWFACLGDERPETLDQVDYSLGDATLRKHPDFVPSWRLLGASYTTITFYILPGAVAIGTYLALVFTDARESAEFLNMIFLPLQCLILVAYLLFLVGLIFMLFTLRAALILVYPEYSMTGAYFDSSTGEMIMSCTMIERVAEGTSPMQLWPTRITVANLVTGLVGLIFFTVAIPLVTPPAVGPWCRRNLISCRPILRQNQTWLPDPNPKPPPAGFGVGIAWSDANPHPGPLPLGR
jgi:hypothetical protein